MVRDGLLIANDADDNKKSHKIVLTLNEATNKMSSTGTQFSSGNWEADTTAYMKSVEQLPYSRIQEIILCAEPFLTLTRRKVRTSSEVSASPDPVTFTNPRSHIRICTVNSLFSSRPATDFHFANLRVHIFNPAC